MEISKFNPCSSQYHAMEDFSALNGSNKFITLALTALAAFISFGFLTAFVFRTLTDKFAITKNLKPDSPQEETAKKVDDTYQKEQGHSFDGAASEENREETQSTPNPGFKAPEKFAIDLTGDFQFEVYRDFPSLDKMQKLLNQMTEEEKICAAYFIISSGNEKALDLLIGENFDFNASYKGFPLIYYVIRKGTSGDSILKKLIEKGIELPERLIGLTPVEWAKKAKMSDESIRLLGGVPDEKLDTIPPQPVYLRRGESLNSGAQNIPQFQMQPPFFEMTGLRDEIAQVPANNENQLTADFEEARTVFQLEFRKEELNLEMLKQLFKAHPNLANEHYLLNVLANKKDLPFLKFLIEDMQLDAKNENMLSFINSDWSEGLKYLASKFPPSSLISEISDSYQYTVFYAAKSKNVSADILELLKPSKKSLEEYFLKELEMTYNAPSAILIDLASEIVDFRFIQNQFEKLYKEKVLAKGFHNTNLSLLKFLVEKCGCKVNSTHLLQLNDKLYNNDEKEIFKYLIEKAHQNLVYGDAFEQIYQMADRNEIKLDGLANIPQEALNKQAKQAFVTALTGRFIGYETVWDANELNRLAETIISKGISLNDKQEELKRALETALQRNNIGLLKALVKVGVNLNQKVSVQYKEAYPLEHAIDWQEAFDIIKPKASQLEYASLSMENQTRIRDLTRYAYASSEHGRSTTLKVLSILKDINGKHLDDETLLNLAISNRLENTIVLLIEAGADRSIKTKEGKTSLDYYLEKSKNVKPNPSVLRALVRSISVVKNDSVSEKMKGDLQAFIKGEQTDMTKEVFETFIKEIENINTFSFDVQVAYSKNSMNLVYFAVKCGNVEVLEMLYQAGTDVRFLPTNGFFAPNLHSTIEALPAEKKALVKEWYSKH
jgi:hypothetical protein